MAPRDYCHSKKAGNIGDVWKHFALARILESRRSQNYSFYLETHCGYGSYDLKEKNRAREWGKGISRVITRQEFANEPFARIVRSLNPQLEFPGEYPGSVYIAKKSLLDLSSDKFLLYDIAPEAAGRVKKKLGLSVRLSEDWPAALTTTLSNTEVGSGIIFIDPPYGKSPGNADDWKVLDNLLRNYGLTVAKNLFIIWYPVFSYTKPDRLHKVIRELGVPCWCIECIVDAPRIKPSQKLKGSGLITISAINNEDYQSLCQLSNELAVAMAEPSEKPDLNRHWRAA